MTPNDCALCRGPLSRAWLDDRDVQRCGCCGYGLRRIEPPPSWFIATRYVSPAAEDVAPDLEGVVKGQAAESLIAAPGLVRAALPAEAVERAEKYLNVLQSILVTTDAYQSKEKK